MSAQIVKMTANKTVCAINEEFVLMLETDTDIDSLGTIKQDGFKIVSGPNVKVKNSYLNGKSTYSRTNSYLLRPTKIGTLTIQSPQFFFRDKAVAANPITIKIEPSAIDGPDLALDDIKNNLNYIENPDESVRFVIAGDIGYVEEMRFGKWVLIRKLTAVEIAQLKKQQ